jgi:hypothetical protein
MDLGFKIAAVDTRELSSKMYHKHRYEFQHDMDRWNPIGTDDFLG